jgi:hypothetical protein
VEHGLNLEQAGATAGQHTPCLHVHCDAQYA